MDGDLNNLQGDGNNQYLQVDLTPRQRKISSPYPLYPFKKPEDYHPSYQQPASYQPQTYRTNDQPPAYPPQTYQPDYQPGDYPVNYQEPSHPGDRPQRIYVQNAVQQGREARPSHSQRAVSADANHRHGNRSETPEGQSDPAKTYRVASGKQDRNHRRKQGIIVPPIDHPPVVQPPDYHDNRRESVESDPDLPQGQGSMTDDDKLNESEKDRKLDPKRDITSDDEAERGMAILRQLHEHSEAARRLEESNDITEDEHDERRERSPEPQDLREKVVESGSATPTNTDPDALSQEDSTMEEEEEEGGRAPQESPVDPQPHPFSPVTLLPPADMDVYYSLSKRRYHVAPSYSEPSHSRQISPGSNAGSFRAHSQLQGPIDDPGGRYARRATRANVLHRAERLLDSRLQTRLQSPPLQNSPRHRIHSPRMSSFAVSKRHGGTLKNQHRRPSQLQRIREMSGRQKNIEQKFSDTRPVVKRVAFVDVGDEDWDDEEVTSFRGTGRDRGPGMTSALTSLSGAVVPREERAGNVSRLSTSRRHYSHNQRSNDVMFPSRRRPWKKTGGGWFTGKKPGLRGSSQNSHQTFSGSEDEGAPHYGLRSYNDSSRFEMTRPPPPLPPIPLYRPEGEQGATGGPNKRARRVWFFRNGDPDSRARLVVVSKKMYPNLDSLLLALENIVPIVSGVKHIFSLPEGRKVKSVRELQDGCYYVCSSVNRFYDVKYGDVREQYWKGGKVTHDESHLFSRPNPLDLQGDLPSPPSSQQQHHRHHHHHHHPHQPGEGRALVVTLISNLQRDSQEKLILNPHTSLPFPSLLTDLHLMVHLPHPPATGIYTLTRPHVKVEGYNQLFHKFRDHKAFLVCGEEGPPKEPPAQPSTPSPRKGKRSQRPADRTTPRRGSFRRTEAVHCEINGKKKELFAPSQMHVDVEGKKPQQRLKLDWVYGYRGRDVRQNLVVLPNTGEVVYFVAAVVILFDRQTHTQKHYTGHTEEVTCLALHPTNPYVASGQLAGPAPEEAAHVRVWDALTLSTCAVIGLGHFSHGVASLSFSHGESDLLLAMEDSERHVMTVWDWSRQDLDVPLARTTTTSDPVVLGCFYPFDPKILITFGKQHLYFWTIFWNQVDGKIMRDKKSGVFEGEIPNFVTSVCFTPNRDVVTGDSNGSVVVWTPDEGDIFRMNYHASQPMTSAHTKSVSSLVLLADGVLLSGGGSEIKAWDSRKGYELLLSRELPEVYGTVRQLVSLTTDLEGPVLLGTSKDFLLEGSLRSGFRPLVQGHSEEVWAVKAHPKEESFFTAGHDAYVIKWSSRDHRPVWTARDSKPCTSMAVDPRGQLVAVGMTSGKVTLYGAKDGKERNSFQAGQAQVNALSFTPADGSGRVQLAVGCHDGFIYLYSVQEDGRVEGQRSAKARHSNMYVMHLDWSTDGRYLQSVLGDYDLVFWDVHNLTHTKAGRTMRDVEWNSCTAPVGYPLVGAWNWLDSGEAINVACRSGDQSCLLTGDSRGRLRLFTYPTIAPRPEFRQVKPFSSNTTATEFLYKDAGVLTSGGSDAAVLQYALEYR